ncbi:MAG: glycosyltransferase family 39 protein [Armatimonadetes bacterium]|nr:glycosyltransferase family 39 protein [Armatimonadota bacterium]
MKAGIPNAPGAQEAIKSRCTRDARVSLRATGVLALIGLLIASAVLRLWGIGWGLPHSGRYYPYHPDESVLLHVVCQVNPLWGDFAPGFYNYGTLYIFLCRLAYDCSAPFLGWGAVPRFQESFSQWVHDFAHLLLIGRLVTVLLGVATVGVTLRLGRLLWGERAGWLAAAFLAVAPLPVLLGHYMTVDVPATFFTTLALAFAAAALRASADRRRLGLIAAAGVAAGLATGVKYNSFPALLVVAVPLWDTGRAPGGRGRAASGALIAVAAFVLAFFVATPGCLLESGKFQMDLSYEMWRNREGQGLIFRHTPPAALYHLGISLPVGLEWPLFLLSVAGLAWSLRHHRQEDVLLWLFILPSFLLLATAERKFVRYVTPLVPPLLVMAGRLVADGWGSLPTAPGRRCRWFWGIAAAVAAGAALAATVAHLGVLSGPDARDQAADFLRRQSARHDIVALGADAWYYTLPIHPTTGCVKAAALYGGPPAWDNVPAGQPRPDLFPTEAFTVLAPASQPAPRGALRLDQLARYRPRRVILTDYEYEDPQRIHQVDPSFRSGILDLLAALERDYVLEREFRPRPSLAGFTWWRTGIPPHDWRYFMPTVRIYRRR